MRPGPPRGDTTSFELTVTDEHAAPPAAGLPPACTAPALIAAGERACLTLITDHLESGEAAIVHKADVTIRAPLPAGATAEVTATVALCTPHSVTYEVLVRHDATIVARGTLEHQVVPVTTLRGDLTARLD